MAFDPGEISQLQDRLEAIATEWMFERVRSFYGVQEIANLTESQIDEVAEYAEEQFCDPYVTMVLRVLVEQWEMAQD